MSRYTINIFIRELSFWALLGFYLFYFRILILFGTVFKSLKNG
jgi:hypothetical protein